MPRFVTSTGRARSVKERLFNRALMAELDVERDRRGMDQRTFANYLGVNESLLSLYRTGNRHPSTYSFMEMEEQLPGITVRVWDRWYALMREHRTATEAGDEASQEDHRDVPDDIHRIGEAELVGLFRR